MVTPTRHASSFRDPSGYMIVHGDRLIRAVSRRYAEHYDRLMSGLYDDLIKRNLLIPHSEIEIPELATEDTYKLLEPERVRFISYPYEWSFSQLRDAALVTLAIQRRALDHGMSLKDASAYNIQFVNNKPVLIDTLSFEAYVEGRPWVAYRQFCQHFLAPLALMSLRDVRLGLLLRDFIDGIPLDLAAAMLPGRTRLNFGLLTHLHLHAGAQKRYTAKSAADSTKPTEAKGAISKAQLEALIDNLAETVRKLKWEPETAWADYYDGDSYSDAGNSHKQTLVRDFLAQADAQTVLDLGANTGVYSRLASDAGRYTVSADFDAGAVELNYRKVKADKSANLLPLVIDLTNPSSAIGWASSERDSFIQRSQVDCVMALALIHHLAISNNVPLEKVAEFFAALGDNLIIEFVPKSDPKVQTLLATREDIFPNYTQAGFEAAFAQYFEVALTQPITDSERVLYLMRKIVTP